jgi:hypothetical protein
MVLIAFQVASVGPGGRALWERISKVLSRWSQLIWARKSTRYDIHTVHVRDKEVNSGMVHLLCLIIFKSGRAAEKLFLTLNVCAAYNSR